jgi:hypothetical protein
MDFSAKVTGCKFFSKIDLSKGYFQIFMHPDDIPKTAIITPFGLFKFLAFHLACGMLEVPSSG